MKQTDTFLYLLVIMLQVNKPVHKLHDFSSIIILDKTGFSITVRLGFIVKILFFYVLTKLKIL